MQNQGDKLGRNDEVFGKPSSFNWSCYLLNIRKRDWAPRRPIVSIKIAHKMVGLNYVLYCACNLLYGQTSVWALTINQLLVKVFHLAAALLISYNIFAVFSLSSYFITWDIYNEIETLLLKSLSVPSGISSFDITNRWSKIETKNEPQEQTNTDETKGSAANSRQKSLIYQQN